MGFGSKCRICNGLVDYIEIQDCRHASHFPWSCHIMTFFNFLNRDANLIIVMNRCQNVDFGLKMCFFKICIKLYLMHKHKKSQHRKMKVWFWRATHHTTKWAPWPHRNPKSLLNSSFYFSNVDCVAIKLASQTGRLFSFLSRNAWWVDTKNN